MKKLILTMLATLSTCLIGCGGANNIYGQTITYKGVFDEIDEKYNSQYSDKTTRQLVSENMSNINWDNVGITIPHTDANEAISFILNHNKQKCDERYGAYKIVMGSEKDKTAKISTKSGEEEIFKVTDVEGMIYEFRDTSDNVMFEFRALNMINGKVNKGTLSETSFTSRVTTCSNMIELPLKQTVKLGEGDLDKIQIVSYANFTN